MQKSLPVLHKFNKVFKSCEIGTRPKLWCNALPKSHFCTRFHILLLLLRLKLLLIIILFVSVVESNLLYIRDVLFSFHFPSIMVVVISFKGIFSVINKTSVNGQMGHVATVSQQGIWKQNTRLSKENARQNNFIFLHKTQRFKYQTWMLTI